MQVEFPMYYKDWVVDLDENGQIFVIDCESYHLGQLDDVAFSSGSLHDCIDFIDGGRDALLSPVLKIKSARFLLPFLRLYLRFRSARVSSVPSFAALDAGSPRDPERPLKHGIEFGGWIQPYADARVGTHPVFNFTAYPPSGFRFVRSVNRRVSRRESLRRKLSVARTCLRYSARLLRKRVPLDFIIAFWATRQLHSDHLKIAPGNQTIVMYPSYLFFVPTHSWCVEIEDMLTLMTPFVSNGTKSTSLDRHHPIIRTLETLLEATECKGVISHLEATAEGLKTVFSDNETIVRKIRHIPLGMPLPPRLLKSKKDAVEILFLNGWAQDKRAAYRRGLLDALKAFSLIAAEFDNVTLTLRCNLPELDEEYRQILSDPKVTVIEEKLPQRDLQALLRRADILLFPAVRIAVTTLIQAMAHSLAIVASDGFGIEEYVKDGVNGLIARGFRGATGVIDQAGLFREDYMPSLRSNPEIAENCAKLLRLLITDPEFRAQLQQNARQYAEAHFSIQRWNERLGPIFSEYVGASL